MGVHCQSSEEVNDAAAFVGVHRIVGHDGNRLLSWCIACQQCLRPPPHPSIQEQRQAATGIWWQGLTEAGSAQNLILGCDQAGRCRTGPRHAQRTRRGVFFTRTARSTVRGWISKPNFCLINLESSRARTGSPGTSCPSRNARTSP